MDRFPASRRPAWSLAISRANRPSSISPMSSRSARATSTSAGSKPTEHSRRRSSSRLRHRTPNRRSARSFAVPRGCLGVFRAIRALRGPASPFPLTGRRPGGLALGLVHLDDLVLTERGQPDGFADPPLDLDGDVHVFGQKRPGVLLPLTELVALVGEPCPALLDDLRGHPHIDEAALLGDPLSVHDVELGLSEG